MTGTDDLLAELRTLRHRARADRHGYAFSLVLFGALILAAPLVYAPAPQVDPYDSFDPRVVGDNLLVRIFRTTAGPDPAQPTLVACYWLFVLVAGFGATTWWYRRRAARVGVETDTRAFLIAAAAGFAGFFLGTYAFSRYAVSLYGAWQVNLSLMFGSLAIAALTLWWNRQALGVFVASVFGAVTFSAIAVYTNKGFSALLVIAGGLLALAWLERSVLLGVVSVLFTLAAVPSTAMIVNPTVVLDPGYLFQLLGWEADWADTRAYALQQLLLPATVLLVGGTVAAVRYRR
ncbi:hypothetical protein [Actinophytocola sp. NPDC049390]|uniref:hypothetical protein n=1 Tax=Actinophytocola sp. NPDC049390 TaxID=3363894 RepID=UPI0037AA12D3